MPVATVILVSQLGVGEVLSLGSGIRAVVGEVVALGLTTRISNRDISAMIAEVEVETGLRIEEVVILVDVEGLVVIGAVSILVELVVDTLGLVVHVTILQVEEHVPP